MTVKNAIKMIDWWLNQKKTAIEELENKWKFSNDSHGVGSTILESERTVIFNLEKIRKELVPSCKHPKKMRDKTANGQWYCMNCNMDL
jgi:hypothetical protein